jgi:RNA polymerase sigma-54 factor
VTSLRDDLAFRQNIQIDEPSLLYILDRVKEMEPAGVFAGNLRECLLLQLLRKTANEPRLLAVKVLENYFEEFSKKHYKKIIRGLHINEELMKEVLDEILKLNPKPGGVLTITNKAATYMVPDFPVINNDGELELRLNSRNAPDLRVSGTYRTMLETYRDTKKKTKEQKDAVMFIKQKIDSAKWFIDAIKQRQQTLTMTMDVIIRLQEKFFLSGDETNIRPMILKDISDRTGFDISTISRVVNSKFVQTEFGTFKLKYFFSESLTTTDGDDVSTKEVKKILQDIIAEESKKKPLSDEKLTNLLKEKSYNIARRTVAKYREQLNIPVARLRKEL